MVELLVGAPQQRGEHGGDVAEQDHADIRMLADQRVQGGAVKEVDLAVFENRSARGALHLLQQRHLAEYLAGGEYAQNAPRVARFSGKLDFAVLEDEYGPSQLAFFEDNFARPVRAVLHGHHHAAQLATGQALENRDAPEEGKLLPVVVVAKPPPRPPRQPGSAHLRLLCETAALT